MRISSQNGHLVSEKHLDVLNQFLNLSWIIKPDKGGYSTKSQTGFNAPLLSDLGSCVEHIYFIARHGTSSATAQVRLRQRPHQAGGI